MSTKAIRAQDQGAAARRAEERQRLMDLATIAAAVLGVVIGVVGLIIAALQ
ncbi:MAG: hypothetical protein HY535_01230 [Chloroflexi bacterium]|nr:hypothetical protein [Chloroflexota bacterium]